MNIIPPENLLSAYAQGIFPMAESRDAKGVEWYSASKRGIIPIEKFHISKNVQRIIRQERYQVRIDSLFREVIKACANRETTWINDLIVNSYDVLHQAGHAHSVEVYLDEKLVGGLYGVHLQAAFFGESMFRTEPEADKVALFYCHRILEKNGFQLWDTQFYTEHLGKFGCEEIEARQYQEKLEEAMGTSCKFIF